MEEEEEEEEEERKQEKTKSHCFFCWNNLNIHCF